MKLIIAVLLLTIGAFAQNTREYYVSGKLRLEGTTDDRGGKVGTWNEFYENGRLKSTIRYNYNKLVSKIEYTVKGNISREVRYDGDYISYEKTAYHVSTYVKGIVRYIDGVSQWTYECDTIYVNTKTGVQHKQVCGYRTSHGNKAGRWNIETIVASPSVMTHIDTIRHYEYVVYDTTSGEFIRYVSGSFSKEFMIRDMKIGGEYRSILEKTYSGFTNSLYTGWKSDKYMTFSSSLRWTFDHENVYSSINQNRHLGVYNCDMQEYMPDKKCLSFDTYLHRIEEFEEIYNRYK